MAIHPKDPTSAGVLQSARKGFAKMLGPLAEFAFECGFNVGDLTSILREGAVRSVTVRQLEEFGRINISGVAVVTGISRFEISKILKSARRDTAHPALGSKSLINRILVAWHSDSKFLNAARRPRNLRIFGRGLTFESLVKAYGRGIPTRAILDEMIRVGAIEVCGTQEVLPRKSLAINHRITPQGIKALSADISDLINSALKSSSDIAKSDFAETVTGTEVWSGPGPTLRANCIKRTQVLIRELQDSLARKQGDFVRAASSPMTARLCVTINYVEEYRKVEKSTSKKRRNLRRNG